jgi:hypothetical protein
MIFQVRKNTQYCHRIFNIYTYIDVDFSISNCVSGVHGDTSYIALPAGSEAIDFNLTSPKVHHNM